MPSVLSLSVGDFQPTKSFPIRGVITMLPALKPTQTVSRSDAKRSASPDCRIQRHRYRASPPFTSSTSVCRTHGTQRSLPMLGSAVSSSTPKDFQPNSHMGVVARPVMKRHAPPGLPWGCPYPAVGTQRALDSAIGLPRKPTSASWMLAFLMPADVRRSFIGPLQCRTRTRGDDYNPRQRDVVCGYHPTKTSSRSFGQQATKYPRTGATALRNLPPLESSFQCPLWVESGHSGLDCFMRYSITLALTFWLFSCAPALSWG